MKKSYRMAAILLAVMFAVLACPVPVGAATSNVVHTGIEADTTGISDIKSMKNVFYLPAGCDPHAVQIETSALAYSFSTTGEHFYFSENPTIDITPGATVDSYANPCYVVYIGGTAVTFYVAKEIPTVYIDSLLGISYLHQSKENRDKEALVLIVDENGKSVYSDIKEDTLSEVKGRGNASFSNEKMPIQIKLGKKTDLFGMGKSKTWILLANYNDSAYIRNDCAFRIANALEMPFTPQSVFVNLYFNGEYQGLYQLIEKTQIGTNRVEITDLEEANEKANPGVDFDSLSIRGEGNAKNPNIADFSYATFTSPEDVTGGYLIELDNLYSYYEKCVLHTRNGNSYTIKSPEVANKDEMSYISNYMAYFEEALYNASGYSSEGKYYTEYCDLESLVKAYIVQEIIKNWDAYVGSIFFYKDSGDTLHAGPVWDFDNSWGNLRRGTFNTDLTELWAYRDNTMGYKDDFGFKLMNHDDAKKLCAELYPIAAQCLEDMLADGGYIDALTDKLSSSAAMDMSRWPIERRNQTFIYFNRYSDGTTNSAVGYLKNFMSVRTRALYDALGAVYVERETATTTQTTTLTTTQTTTSSTKPIMTAQTISSSETQTTANEPTPGETSLTEPIIVIAVSAISVTVILISRHQRKKENGK